MQQFGAIAQHLLDFLFPPHCVRCKRSGHVLCPSCAALIKPLHPPLCQKCCTPLLTNTFCRRCSSQPLHLNGLRIASNYTEPLRSYIHMFKYNGNRRLGTPLGALLAQAYKVHRMEADCIIPVPLHPERERERGYNQSQILALACAAQLNLPVHTTLLQRTRPTSSQVHLSWQDRQQNVRAAFQYDSARAEQEIAHRRIVLVDDVCTTGSTLSACAAPLFQAGASEVWGLALARPM